MAKKDRKEEYIKLIKKNKLVLYKAFYLDDVVDSTNVKLNINTSSDIFGISDDDAIRECCISRININEFDTLESLTQFIDEYWNNKTISIVKIKIDNADYFDNQEEIDNTFKDGCVCVSLDDYQKSGNTFSIKLKEVTINTICVDIKNGNVNITDLEYK